MVAAASVYLNRFSELYDQQSICLCIMFWVKGSAQDNAVLLPSASHITVLSHKTSWWHGFSQGQTQTTIP